MQPSVLKTLLFALLVCAVCSVLVSTAAVTLHDRQEENKRVDTQKKVLSVAGLLEPKEAVSPGEVTRRFEENLETVLIDLESGEPVGDMDPEAYDQRKAQKDPQQSSPAPSNKAKVRRVPDVAKIFLKKAGERVEAIILPVEGMGLWSTLYGYVALSGEDANTVEGLIFYEHGETPGLGGEVDNPNWKALWPGREIYDDSGEPAIQVIKGRAGSPDRDPHKVDGLAGATLTSNGVTNLLHFWLGEQGFKTYLDAYRRERGL